MDSKLLFQAVDEILPEITNIRHTIHRTPEIGGREFKTAALIRKVLAETSIELRSPFLETDVVGLLNGGKTGKNVTLRADIDALPLEEKTGVPYASEVPGMMHACGHDGHTAMLLGAALVLDKLKEHLNGSVRFVFQPGEEIIALGKALVEAGALLNPEPARVFALHGFDGLPLGSIASRPGAIMAAAEFFKITVKGKGGHGSRPNLAIDPILTGARIVDALQAIPARFFDAQHPLVLTVCSFNSGFNSNVIPDTAVIEGTTRYLDKCVGDKLPQLVEQVVKGVCDSLGAGYEFEYTPSYRPTLNDAGVIDFAREISRKYFGEDNWQDIEFSSMAGEDFCYYLDKYPGAFCRVGLGEDAVPLHNPHFDFNDKALRNGIIFMAAAAIETLNSEN